MPESAGRAPRSAREAGPAPGRPAPPERSGAPAAPFDPQTLALSRALAGLDVGIAVFDRAARLTACNRRYQSLFGDAAPGEEYGVLLARHTTALALGEAHRVAALAVRPDPAGAPLPSPQVFRRAEGGWLELEERAGEDGALVCLWTDVTRRLEAEAQVAHLQARLRDAIQCLPDGFALFGADGRLEMHNSGLAERYGRSPDEPLAGARFEELLRRAIDGGVLKHRWDDAAGRESWIAEALARHRNPAGPVEVQLADGRWIRVAETRTQDGGVVGIHADITELKRREAELARRTALLDAITYAATRIIGQDWQSGAEDLLDRLGRALQVERAGLHQVLRLDGDALRQACLFEWTAEGVPRLCDDPTLRVTRLGGGADSAAADGWVARLSRGEAAHGPAGPDAEEPEGGSWLRVPILVDGGWWGHIAFADSRPGRAWSALEMDVLATAAAMLASAIQRTRLDGALHKSEARKQAIVETALDCILTVDASGLLVEFNPAAERILGFRREAVLGQRMEDLIVPPAERTAHRAGFARFLAGEGGGRIGRRVEVTAQRADGTAFPAELSVTPIRVDGELFFTAHLRDITERVQGERALLDAKARAEAAAQAKSAFLNNMSHELRTPLNAIIGFSELIRDAVMGPLGSPKYREFAHDIHESGSRLLRIINDVLDMSRIEAGEMRLMMETMELGPVVESCFQMVRDHAVKGEVALIDDVSALPLALYADRRAMMTVLLQLLSNAVKFTPPGGRARVGAEREADGTLVLVVSDTGVGIPPDLLAQVFEPFQQAEMALSRRHEGVGLGLAVARALVEAQGGSIALDSAVGRGTTVTLRFPPQED